MRDRQRGRDMRQRETGGTERERKWDTRDTNSETARLRGGLRQWYKETEGQIYIYTYRKTKRDRDSKTNTDWGTETMRHKRHRQWDKERLTDSDRQTVAEREREKQRDYTDTFRRMRSPALVRCGGYNIASTSKSLCYPRKCVDRQYSQGSQSSLYGARSLASVHMQTLSLFGSGLVQQEITGSLFSVNAQQKPPWFQGWA